MNPPAVDAACALVDSLLGAGAVHFCVCPGNRSAPFAFALASRAGASVSVHVDERSAAFFGLGHALATGAPVVLVCTSGSAGAHWLPALVEADAAGVPLIAITADRPSELHDCGADQTMPQTAMFAPYVRWAVDIPAPVGLPHEAPHCARIAVRAVAEALGPRRGPVHINARFREPLEPAVGWQRPAAPPAPRARRPQRPAETGRRGGSCGWMSDPALARLCDARSRTLIVLGPGSRDESLAMLGLARHLGAAVLADALSGVRDEPGVLTTYDAILRHGAQPGWSPDVVVRCGASPTSKALRTWLAGLVDAQHVVVDAGARWREPDLLAATFVAQPVSEFVAEALQRIAPRSDTWADAWAAADAAARAVLAASTLPEEAAVMAAVLRVLQGRDHLHVASSMPVRDLDLVATALPIGVTVTANRGVNGIDGTISTALGIAAASSPGRTYCVLGDVAALHDISGLAAAGGLRATFVVVNNGGGGIFGFLPSARHPEVFERFFLTPPSVELRSLCAGFGVAWRGTGPDGAQEAVSATRDLDGVALIEVCCDREASRDGHRTLWAAMARAGSEALGSLDVPGGPDRPS